MGGEINQDGFISQPCPGGLKLGLGRSIFHQNVLAEQGLPCRTSIINVGHLNVDVLCRRSVELKYFKLKSRGSLSYRVLTFMSPRSCFS